MQLYKSQHFVLSEIRISGKKQTRGALCFEGLPSVYGSDKEVVALEDGIVLRAGRNADIHSREHRLGTLVTLSGHDGATVTYARLAARYVNEGDYVKKGEVIGIQGSSGTGTGEYLLLEFRRNGRRIDGCEYLGIQPNPVEFRPPHEPSVDVVCRVCGLNERMRTYIESCPDAQEIWSRVRSKLENTRVRYSP